GLARVGFTPDGSLVTERYIAAADPDLLFEAVSVFGNHWEERFRGARVAEQQQTFGSRAADARKYRRAAGNLPQSIDSPPHQGRDDLREVVGAAGLEGHQDSLRFVSQAWRELRIAELSG